MLNEDYRDMLRALSDEKVRFLLVGAYALAAHGYPRATMDIDIWVLPSPQNADAVLRAVRRFGAPLHSLSKEDFQKDGNIFQIGVAPRRIDIITSASGLQFEETYGRSLSVNIEGIKVHIPSIDDLICNKRASGRTRDLADAEALESLKNSEDITPPDKI
jgi:predicted nucleotidyltransferase